MRRVRVAGVDVDSMDVAAVRQAIRDAVQAKRQPPLLIATVNLDHLAKASRNPRFAAALRASTIVTPDGMPVLWLARLAGRRLPERVTGSDLTAWLLDGGLPGASLYLVGGSPAVADHVTARARRSNTRVIGADTSGPEVFASPAASADLATRIAGAAPDIVLVALGAPRQEVWIAEHGSAIGASVVIGVGASLDLASGRIARAPRWMQRMGLEWLFRLSREPGRLWRRYLLDDIPFFAATAIRIVVARARGAGATGSDV